MEACFSQLTLDVIGKAVFNYDFEALNTNSPIIQVGGGVGGRGGWVGVVGGWVGGGYVGGWVESKGQPACARFVCRRADTHTAPAPPHAVHTSLEEVETRTRSPLSPPNNPNPTPLLHRPCTRA